MNYIALSIAVLLYLVVVAILWAVSKAVIDQVPRKPSLEEVKRKELEAKEPPKVLTE